MKTNKERTYVTEITIFSTGITFQKTIIWHFITYENLKK